VESENILDPIVVERDATERPIARLLASSSSVDLQVAAKRCVLRRETAVSIGSHDGIELSAGDLFVGEAPLGILHIRITDLQGPVEAAVPLSRDQVLALRRPAVSFVVLVARWGEAERDIVATGNSVATQQLESALGLVDNNGTRAAA
jgi:hypothetical protein